MPPPSEPHKRLHIFQKFHPVICQVTQLHITAGFCLQAPPLLGFLPKKVRQQAATYCRIWSTHANYTGPLGGQS
jgi:hypothetical protein